MSRIGPGLLALVAVLAVACGPSASASPTVTASQSAAPSRSAASSPSAEPTSGAAGWREITPSGGPAPREDHSWTVAGDSGDVAYLFGGRAGATVLADLWAYDLHTDSWSQAAASGPAARFGHNAAWVDGVGLVVFAGQGERGFFNDLWAFDPSTAAWRQLSAGGAVPVPRYGSCAGIGPDGRLWISHGFTSEGARFADTRAYDFATAAWTDETPVGGVPIQRCLHGCWWTDDGMLTLYAGQTDGVTALADEWQLTVGPRPGTNAWREVASAAAPPARNLYGAARWGATTVVVGGQGADANYLADAWQLGDDGTAVPINLQPNATGPAGRSGTELITDPARARLLLFGGRDASGHFNDVWELTLP